MVIALGGIWRERPRARKSGLLGVFGVAETAWSSLETRRVSRKLGDGASVDRGVLSDKERAFEEDLEGVRSCLSCSCIPTSIDVSILSSLLTEALQTLVSGSRFRPDNYGM